jgi:nucleoside-diphosphate-sugar epimerase
VATNENLSIRKIAEIALTACDAGDMTLLFDQTSPDGQFRKDVSNRKMLSYLNDFEFTPLAEGIRLVYDHYVKNNIV